VKPNLLLCAATAALLASCAHAPAVQAPAVQSRAKPIVTVDGLKFKDLNANGRLDAYEDWRRPVDGRVADLVAQEQCGIALSGKAGPQGRLPFALANDLQAVIDNQPEMTRAGPHGARSTLGHRPDRLILAPVKP